MRYLIACLLFASPAYAEPVCADRDTIVTAAASLGQVPRFVALSSEGSLVEILLSSDGRWTAIVTMPSGVSCISAMGQAGNVLPGGVAG